MTALAYEAVGSIQKIGNSVCSKLDYQALASILKSCAARADIQSGKGLHSYAVKLGHTSCQLVSKALLNMYAKSNALNDCQKLFGQIRQPDTVMWNIVLAGFSGTRNHDNEVMTLFHAMHIGMDPKPSSVTVAIVLPVCARSGALDAGKSVHSYVIKSGLLYHTLVGNALVSLYAKAGHVYDEAYHVFETIADKDVVSWNAMIAGFAENNFVGDAFSLFSSMVKGPISPNYATIANILPVCSLLKQNVAYLFGKEIHCHVLRRTELGGDISVTNALVGFYSRIDHMHEAVSVFRRMRVRDSISWNSIISGYTSNSEWSRALKFFRELLSLEGIVPDSVTLLSVLPACAHLCNLQVGRQIHGYIIQHPQMNEDTSVANALLSFYAKCGDIEAAFRTFSSICWKDLVSWNAMLDSFSESQLTSQFIGLLQWMFEERIRPDSITILAVTRFCASLSRLDKVKEVHGFSMKSGLLSGDALPTLGNAVIDAYAKCGDMDCASKVFGSLSGKRNVVTGNSIISGYVSRGSHDDAHKIFNSMPERDVTTWNLMIRAYAENDCPDEAISLMRDLEAHGMKPDALTVMSIIPVCVQMASVQFLSQCHGYVTRCCFEDVHLKAALIDVYSKCGSICSAYKLFQSTDQKDLVIFTAMVGGYAMHGMGNKALGVFHNMLKLGMKPDHVIITSILSACSHSGLVDEGLNIFYSMESIHGIKPTNEQYSCVVDLLSRGGRVKDAYSFVTKMPMEANAEVWGTLLGACRKHNETEIGQIVAEKLFESKSSDIGNYVVLSNLYAADDRWDRVVEIRKLMKTRDLKKPAGCSWIELEKKKNVFVAGDWSHPQRSIIYETIGILDTQSKDPFQFEVAAV